MRAISSIPNIYSKTARLDSGSAPLLRLLVVSKELASLDPLATIAGANDWRLEAATSGWEALDRVQSGARPDLVLLDLGRQNVEDGMHTLRWLRRLRPELPVLVLAHSHDLQQKTEAIRMGAREYLVQPLMDAQLESAVKRHLPFADSENDFESPTEEVERIGDDRVFIVASSVMRRLRAQADLLAQLDVPVMIVGEPGSGKETLARLIHKLSVRSGFRFLKVNCAALGGDLLDLFGSPAAEQRVRPGKFEFCRQGTILLDKLTEMPAAAQSHLMRVLEEKQSAAAHDGGATRFDVRVIATTSSNIEASLADRSVRQDLYYQLSSFTMHIAPLRQRRNEVPLLLGHFMNQFARRYGLEPTPFSSTLLHACQQYAWPGNLWQLESFVKRYLVTHDEEAALGELQNGLRFAPGSVTNTPEDLQGNTGENSEGEDRNSGLKSLVQTVKGEAERGAILSALEQTHWNRRAAARLLQVSYRTLLYKIQQYNMTPVRFLSPMTGSNGPRGNGHGH